MSSILQSSSDLMALPRGQASSGKSSPAGGVPAKPCAALVSLRKKISPEPSTSFKTLIFAAVTFGIGPAIVWPVQFARVIGKEGRTFRVLSNWAAGRAHPDEAKCMLKSAGRIKAQSSLLLIGVLGVLLAVLGGVWGTLLLTKHPGSLTAHGIGLPIHATYLFLWDHLHGIVPSRPVFWSAYAMWAGGLSLAYLSHLAHVHLHARATRAFLADANRFLIDEGTSPAFLQPIGLGFAPVWRLGGFLAMLYSSPWGILMTMAGATQQRYQCRASAKLRAALEVRVKELVLMRPMADARHVVSTATSAPVNQCETPGCHLQLPEEAKFCPKCGVKRGRRELD